MIKIIIKIINATRKIKSITKCLVLKLVYKNYIKGHMFILGKNSKFIINESTSKICVGKKFCCRDNVKIKISGGILEIGNDVFINDNSSIICRKNISIGNNCLIGQNVYIYDNDHKYEDSIVINNQGFKSSQVKIGNNVWIGTGAIILRGVTIGDNVVIGAGSIVKKNIPQNTVFYNNLESKTFRIKKFKNN